MANIKVGCVVMITDHACCYGFNERDICYIKKEYDYTRNPKIWWLGSFNRGDIAYYACENCIKLISDKNNSDVLEDVIVINNIFTEALKSSIVIFKDVLEENKTKIKESSYKIISDAWEKYIEKPRDMFFTHFLIQSI